ncbi:hypothetical protein HBB16_05260 [Pseudonocardia sp. MCCB 268]|nr:hypothetical protein [Pseudonocardia cytotoxica]
MISTRRSPRSWPRRWRPSPARTSAGSRSPNAAVSPHARRPATTCAGSTTCRPSSARALHHRGRTPPPDGVVVACDLAHAPDAALAVLRPLAVDQGYRSLLSTELSIRDGVGSG